MEREGEFVAYMFALGISVCVLFGALAVFTTYEPVCRDAAKLTVVR